MRGREKEIRKELRAAMTSFLSGIDPPSADLPASAVNEIVAVSRYATQGRTGVERDGYSREIVVVPELEVPTRFAKAASALVSALMAMGYTETGALDVIARVGRDSMPQVRVLVLAHLIGAVGMSTPDLATATNLPVSTVRQVAEDLTAIGLVERQGTGQDLRWNLTSDGLTTTGVLAIERNE